MPAGLYFIPRSMIRNILFLALVPVASFLLAVTPACAQQKDTAGYVLQNNDLIKITVFGEEDMTTEARISKSGFITFPLLGSLQLAGKTVETATAEIRAALDKDYIINPQVTFAVMEYAKQWVTVLGQVQKPGQVEIPAEGGLDLLGAVALAGGYTRIADAGSVTVRRKVNGVDTVIRLNAKALASNTNAKQFYVKPGDVIVVSESLF
jgi:polysaccharide export outer membrane protein